MDPVTLVVAALAAGAGKGVSQAASTAVGDAYTALKGRMVGLPGGTPTAELVVVEHEQNPVSCETPLRTKLAAAGADQVNRADPLVATAQQLLQPADPEGTRGRTYLIGSITADRGGVAAARITGNVTTRYQPTTR